jgi:hypothetical protein
MTPRFGEPREAGRRYRRRRGVYAVLWRDGRILLTHQAAAARVPAARRRHRPGRKPAARAAPRGVRGNRLAHRAAAPAGGLPPLHLHAGIRSLGRKAVHDLRGREAAGLSLRERGKRGSAAGVGRGAWRARMRRRARPVRIRRARIRRGPPTRRRRTRPRRRGSRGPRSAPRGSSDRKDSRFARQARSTPLRRACRPPRSRIR